MMAPARFLSVLILLGSLAASRVGAFPQFQAFSQQHSGRPVNCGMCHMNPDGPSGSAPNQLGSLTPEEMQRVNLSRGAREPGQNIDNPILNAFGNHIIEAIGSRKLYELRGDPAGLATALANVGDIDGDGISDADEFLDGTDPLNRFHGDPGKLLLINLRRNWGQVTLAVVFIGLILFGLSSLAKGIAAKDDLLDGKSV